MGATVLLLATLGAMGLHGKILKRICCKKSMGGCSGTKEKQQKSPQGCMFVNVCWNTCETFTVCYRHGY